MTTSDSKLKLIGNWQRDTATTDRWHSLQSSISRQAAPAYGWARRLSVNCRWRAVPASVSARASTGMV
jgi:hypothetical protein